MKEFIVEVKNLKDVSFVKGVFSDNVDSMWTKGSIFVAPKQKVKTFSELLTVFREIMNVNLFQSHGFERTNQFTTAFATGAKYFEPLRLCFGKGGEASEREVRIFLFPCKESASLFLKEGKDPMHDKTTFLK